MHIKAILSNTGSFSNKSHTNDKIPDEKTCHLLNTHTQYKGDVEFLPFLYNIFFVAVFFVNLRGKLIISIKSYKLNVLIVDNK